VGAVQSKIPCRLPYTTVRYSSVAYKALYCTKLPTYVIRVLLYCTVTATGSFLPIFPSSVRELEAVSMDYLAGSSSIQFWQGTKDHDITARPLSLPATCSAPITPITSSIEVPSPPRPPALLQMSDDSDIYHKGDAHVHVHVHVPLSNPTRFSLPLCRLKKFWVGDALSPIQNWNWHAKMFEMMRRNDHDCTLRTRNAESVCSQSTMGTTQNKRTARTTTLWFTTDGCLLDHVFRSRGMGTSSSCRP